MRTIKGTLNAKLTGTQPDGTMQFDVELHQATFADVVTPAVRTGFMASWRYLLVGVVSAGLAFAVGGWGHGCALPQMPSFQGCGPGPSPDPTPIPAAGLHVLVVTDPL